MGGGCRSAGPLFLPLCRSYRLYSIQADASKIVLVWLARTFSGSAFPGKYPPRFVSGPPRFGGSPLTFSTARRTPPKHASGGFSFAVQWRHLGKMFGRKTKTCPLIIRVLKSFWIFWTAASKKTAPFQGLWMPHPTLRGQPDGYAANFHRRHAAHMLGKIYGLWALSFMAFNAVWKTGKNFPRFPRRFCGVGKTPTPTTTRTFAPIDRLRHKEGAKMREEHKRC